MAPIQGTNTTSNRVRMSANADTARATLEEEVNNNNKTKGVVSAIADTTGVHLCARSSFGSPQGERTLECKLDKDTCKGTRHWLVSANAGTSQIQRHKAQEKIT